MSKETNMQLAAALRIIENLLKGDSGADQEAKEFLKGIESGELPKPQRFFLHVSKGPKELPGFAAYITPSVSENKTDEGIPVGQALLNLDATLWVCVDNPELHWEEMVAESITHETLHCMQELFGQALEEYHIEESIEAARESVEPSKWQTQLETAMMKASEGSTIMLMDEEHPEASLHLVKNERPSPETIESYKIELGQDLEKLIPEWYPIAGTLNFKYYEEQGESKIAAHWVQEEKDEDK